MEEAKGQSILDKMLTTFINTLVKAAENEAQTHFGKNLEEVLKHFMAKVNSDFEKQCLLWYFTKKGQTMTVSSEVFERIAKAAVASRAASEKLFHGPQKVIIKGKVYYSQTISFYENDEFDYALGCATIFFDEEGVPVGLKDIYDFNEAKHRDTNAESDTTFMAKFEKANLAKSYAILYGLTTTNLMTDVSRAISSCIIALFCCLLPVFSITGEHPVLIISSYNPDAGRTSGNISDFMEEFQRLGGTNTIALENMNCKSFSESPLWERRMVELLSKYQGDNSPALTVLIGQEAWAAYLSLPDSIRGNTPVVSALSSRNAILLPGDTVDLKTWMPESVDFFTDFPSSPIKAGFVYEYDVEANINMIKQMYPGTKNIAFVSDNSYGGVAMQAYVVKEMQKFPELNLILLDGRVHTIYTICDRLHELPENTAILMGTWRVDMNDGYFMRNATYAMMEAAPTLPTFSLSSVGLGYWAVAGVVPAYRALGKEMARQSYRLLTTPQDSETHMEIIPNETILDGKLVKEKKLNIAGLPQPVKMLNVTPSFYEQYKYHIWSVGAVLLVLLGGLFVSLYFYYHTKKLKDELEVSEGALREAKDRAEESSRLKSAFLANMSHEIRTPLNAIVGFSDVLSAGGASEEEQRGYFEIIRTNSDLLLRLINDILDVSRLEADRVILSLESCNVVQICQQVVASVAQARRSTNQFLFECEREVVEMRTDVQRLQQVVINLLSNADKFTKEGTITLKLEPDTARNVAVFSVTDSGCGIPLDKQKRVFERFEKLNEYVQGTGLGLSICKLTVEKWGGEIWIDPAYTNGARFMFTHPMNL